MVGEIKSNIPEEVELSEDEDDQEATPQKAVERTKLQLDEKIPAINVREKIILCLDVTSSCSKITLFPGKNVEPLLLLKQSVLIFINNKLSWSPQTEVSIILLNGSSVYVYLQFTSNKDEIIEKIKRIHVPPGDGDTDMEDDEKIYCLDDLFKTVSEHVVLPAYKSKKALPAFLVRCIFFYSRSKFLSYNILTDHYQTLFKSPYFVFDSIFLHNNELDENVRKKIINDLSQLDNGYSYILETDANVVNFMNTFSFLSSHPLQRPHQSEIESDVTFFKKTITS